MPVVKANAYGHGLVPVTRYLRENGYSTFGVAYPEEGAMLKTSGIDASVVVFTLPNAAQSRLVVDLGLEPTVATEESVEVLRSAAERENKHVDVHLKIETGMNRIGVRPGELASLLRRIAGSRRLRIRSVYTHFATSDRPRSRFVGDQKARFEAALEMLRREGVEPEHVHAANSGAILRYPETYYTMVRPGILTYGYSPFGEDDPLAKIAPAMRLRTEVAQVKRIATGESVSYGRTYRAKKPTTVATVPVGYADGLFRGLSGRGQVLVGGRRCQIIGRVCMDQTMVDCGAVRVRPGDEVVLIGKQGRQTLSAWEPASLLGTIPYELTCAVSGRVPREYIS